MNIKYLQKKKELVKHFLPLAIQALSKEYPKPQEYRVKLTHYWLAEQLDISKGLAFAVLAQVAYQRKYCLRLPEGAIYWLNEPLPAGMVLDAVVAAQANAVQEDATEPQQLTAKEGETPVLPFEPYGVFGIHSAHNVESESLLKKSNALASEIWKDSDAYYAHKPKREWNPGKPQGIALENSHYFNMPDVRNAITNALGINGVSSSNAVAYQSSVKRDIDILIAKIATLEKKHGQDALIEDIKQEDIVKQIFFRDIWSETKSDLYGGYHISLLNDKQPALVNNLLSEAELRTVDQIINFPQRMRALFGDRPRYKPEAIVELISKKLDFDQYWVSYGGVSAPVVELFQKVEVIRDFLYTVIPKDIIRDFIFKHGASPTNFKAEEAQRKASRALRDTVVMYANGDRGLADLLTAIVGLADTTLELYLAKIDAVDNYFEYFNRIELSFEQLVKESKDPYIARNNEEPF